MKNSVTRHSDSEMVILHLSIMFKLEHDIYVVTFLHLNGYDISLLIEGINRNIGIIHLLSEACKMQTHYLIDSFHRIILITLQPFIIQDKMFSI